MRRLIPFILVIFCTVTLHAQNFTVNGVVSDGTANDPLPGVSVVVKNTNKGAQTDFNGNYQIDNVTQGSILVFSYIGYESQEIVVDKATINVSLVEGSEKLEEVVVIGYGTQRKKEVTGAVSIISSEAIENLKPTRVEQALQGQVAGVNVTTTSGSPGAASSIRIRGVSTNGDNQPLILVDGNRIEDLSTINPSDIESINVLKDATAGIYGVQAANGVIIVTTKSGRKNSDFKFIFNSYAGVQETSRYIPLLNATEYGLLANEAFAANGEALPYSNVSGLRQGTNWQDEVFQTALISSNDINITKGTEKGAYGFSASYLDQDGIVGGGKSNFNRFTTRLNVNYDILDNLKLTSSVIYTNTNKKNLNENVIGSVLYNALNFAPTLSIFDDNGNYTLTPADGFGSEVINPMAQIDAASNNTEVNKIAPNIGLNYKFWENFSADAKFQYNYANVNTRTFNAINTFGESSTVFDNLNTNLSNYKVAYEDYIFDAYVNFEKNFNDIHDVKVLVGTSVSKATFYNKINIAGFDLVDGDLNSNILDAPRVEDYNVLGNAPDKIDGARLLSYFTRLQYNYKGKYLLSAVLRRDGSTKFGPENKFGFFPTASIGWVASDENFLSDSNALTFLKLRASYGIIGNDRIDPFRFVSLLNGEGEYVFDDGIIFGTAAGALSNPEIRWEKQKPLNIGFDLELFDKVDITADYFYKETEDLLLSPQVSGILGVSAPGALAPIVNAGTVLNKGFEFAIGYKDNITEDLSFGINYNFTTLENEVLFVASDNGFEQGGSFGVGQEAPSRMEAGYPIGYFYGLETNGVFQSQDEVDSHATQTNASPGDLRFVDTNGDGTIDADDRTYIGDPIADITMGLNLSLNYKQFDFNLYGFASIGNEIVRDYERTVPLTNRSVYFLDRWTGPGTSTTDPRVTTGATGNNLFSDYFVEDGSFFRLQNIQFGYTLNDEFAEQIGIDKLRFYVSGNNLFTITDYKGYDPTASNGSPIGGGIDKGFYPSPKMYLVGLNVNF